jgi:oxaloacetate decarboxylase alpha subunit
MQPVLKLLRELAKRPATSDVIVEKPGFRLELHRGAAREGANA